MKNFMRLVLLAAIIAAGAWLWTVFHPGPQQMIRKRLAAVASDASFDSAQSAIVSANNVEALANSFATNAEVNLEVPERIQQTFSSRDEIKQAYLVAHAVVSGLKVEFLDVNVAVGGDKMSATADATLKAQVLGEKDFIALEWKITLEKIDGDWLITRIETLRTLS
jgi:ketosteroid isomerase-like protein